MADYYELLEVTRNASDDEIRSAYRRLARELHPDANGGDPASEARFKEVNLAYETLRDPERRRRYDMFGDTGQRGQQAPGDVFGAGGLGDLFDAFFNNNPFGGTRSQGPQRGEDLEVTVELDLEAAIFGENRPVNVRGPKTCSTCHGSGAKPGTEAITCLECAGMGQVRRVRQSILGQVVTTSACARCRGVGRIVEHPCARCRGDGRVTLEETVTIEVPPGIDDATTLRIEGAGAAAVRGGPPGDLYVHLRVARHDRFDRHGLDLVATLHIPLVKAALGATVEVETFDGTQTIKIPEGTQSGRVFRFRGLGVPHVRGRGRGELLVEVVVDTPTELSDEERALLRQLALVQNEVVDEPEGGLFSRIRSSFS